MGNPITLSCRTRKLGNLVRKQIRQWDPGPVRMRYVAPGIDLDPLRDLVSQKTRMTYFKVYDIEPVEDVYTERRLPKKDCQMKDGQMTAVHKWSRAPAATSKSR